MSYLDGNYVLGSEYLVDILFWVKQHERRPSLRYKKISPQLAKRGQLIEWARDVNSKLGFCDITFHLAVRLIDLFMDGHDIAVSISIRFETTGHFYLLALSPLVGSTAVFGGLGRALVGS